MVDLILEFVALPSRRPRASCTGRVLHPSAPSASLAPFEIARDPIDQPTVYYRWHPKRNIKTPSCGTHCYMFIFVYIDICILFFIYLYDFVYI